MTDERLKLGMMSFGDLSPDPETGGPPDPGERLEKIIEAAVMTEDLGLDAFMVGEHHSTAWVLTAPPVVLAAIAAKTQRIRLMTGVTLLANLDPVRAAEDYATLDLLSGGRLDMVAARGIFPHPWTLFGQDPDEARDRLAESIDLLLRIWTEDPISWSGKYRPALEHVSIGPRPFQRPPAIWCGVSTAPSSVEFAARRGLPIFIGASAHTTEHYGTLVDHYREVGEASGHAPESLRVGCGGTFYVRKNGTKAKRDYERYYRQGAQFSVTHSRMEPKAIDYQERMAGPLICGSPAEATERILEFHERFGHQFHLFQADVGGLPWPEVVESMELLASEVAPAVAHATSTPAIG